jgi:sterol desaturase/sphingolipid hydroxylase (fatty acid hydroxylase superfamily)
MQKRQVGIQLHDDSVASSRCLLALLKSQAAHVDAIILLILFAFLFVFFSCHFFTVTNQGNFCWAKSLSRKKRNDGPRLHITHKIQILKIVVWTLNYLTFFALFKYQIGYWVALEVILPLYIIIEFFFFFFFSLLFLYFVTILNV